MEERAWCSKSLLRGLDLTGKDREDFLEEVTV